MPDFDLGREVLDQVREAADVLEVIGDHVKLRRRGRTWEGLCPFHEEKTPSFSVDPTRGLYYCFGCHRGGDIFKFVMEIERLGFGEAVERLAGRFGVKLPVRSPEARRRQSEADRIRGLLDEAQRFFVDELAGPGGASARGELARRGFDGAACREFGFGWAADEWRRLTDHLARRHPEGTLIAAGLTVASDTGRQPYDRFRNRITFPIRGSDGRLVGFGGRVLGTGEPKYLNSPESVVFRKRSTLFCLDRARPAIRRTSQVVGVEGYFDCLSLHRAGITNSVATLGTALTEDHGKLLRRDLGVAVAQDGRQPQVLLCYDADAAGRRAARTGIRVLLEAGVGVAVIELPPGTDPDDVVRDGGSEKMAELLERPTSVIDYLMADLPSTPAERQRAGAAIAELIGTAQDPHARDELLMELSLRLGFSQEVLRDLGRRARRPAGQPGTRAAVGLGTGEAMLVRIIVEGGTAWRNRVAEEVDPSVRVDPRVGRLVEAAREFRADPSIRTADDFVEWLTARADDELTGLVARICTSEAPPLTDDTIRRQLLVTLSEQRRTQARKVTESIRQAERDGDHAAVAELQARLTELLTRRPDF